MAVRYTPDQYRLVLGVLNKDWQASAVELADAFPYAKTFPNIQKYQDRLMNDQGNMDEVRGDNFQFKDFLQQDIDKTAYTAQRIMNQIEKVEKDNAKLIVQLQELEDQREGAIGMYDDSRFLYNFKLLQNWLMFGAVGGLGYGIYKAYTK
tara:strand:+ start:474 stop:923 length:450 start_codon:yes stop_codon:yes gene_type:complete